MSVHFVIILIFMKYSYMIIHTLQTSTDEISHKIDLLSIRVRSNVGFKCADLYSGYIFL